MHNFLRSIFIFCITGILFFLFYIPHDRFIHRWLENQIATACTAAYDCPFSVRVHDISLISGIVTLSDVGARDPQEKWQWKSPHVAVTIRWRDSLKARTLIFDCTLHGVHLQSAMESYAPAILPHLAQLVAPPSVAIPLMLRHLSVRDVQYHFTGECASTGVVSGDLDVHGTGATLTMRVRDAVLQHVLGNIEKFEGTVTVEFPDERVITSPQITCFGTGTLKSRAWRCPVQLNITQNAEGKSVHCTAVDGSWRAQYHQVPEKEVPEKDSEFLLTMGEYTLSVCQPTPSNFAKASSDTSILFSYTISHNNKELVHGNYISDVQGITISVCSQEKECAKIIYKDHSFSAHIFSEPAVHALGLDQLFSSRGDLKIVARQENDRWKFTGEMEAADIVIPALGVTLISTQCAGEYNPDMSRISFSNIHAQSVIGEIFSTSGSIQYKNSAITVHIPLTVSGVRAKLLDAKVLASGNIVGDFCKRWKISGALTIDEGKLETNVLAPNLGESSHDLLLDLKVTTKNPITVTTPSLATYARVTAQVRGSLSAPSIAGTIELGGGKIIFPYAPLYIQHGTLTFIPQQLDPLIELMAHNTIKKYGVTLSVRGTAAQPQLVWTTVPALSEEQIAGLLIGGVEAGALAVALPPSVTASLEEFIFGSAAESSALHERMRRLFNPLKKVKIIPSLSDPSGRGGMRAAVAVEVGDHWRAQIGKNFTLSEDVLIDVEYRFSDEVSAKIVSDERGDVGAVVEGRWKW